MQLGYTPYRIEPSNKALEDFSMAISEQNKNNLIWLDLEMTGLNPDQDHIIAVS